MPFQPPALVSPPGQAHLACDGLCFSSLGACGVCPLCSVCGLPLSVCGLLFSICGLLLRLWDKTTRIYLRAGCALPKQLLASAIRGILTVSKRYGSCSKSTFSNDFRCLIALVMRVAAIGLAFSFCIACLACSRATCCMSCGQMAQCRDEQTTGKSQS